VNGATTRISPAANSTGALLGRNGIYHNPHLVTHDPSDAGTDDTVIFQEQCPDASIEAYAGYLYGPTAPGTDPAKFPRLTGRTYTPTVTRLAAADRYSEAALIAKKGFPQGTANVVIASGETFADALVAAPLAKALDAPILLVRHDALPSATASAISYLGAKKAYVVGGKVTVEDGVVKKLLATSIDNVDRIAAANRYDTAALVAQKLFALKGSPEVAYIANGEKFADGLSIGAVAASLGQPVLLVKPGYVPPSVTSTLARLTPAEIVIVGGPASVTPVVAEQLGADGRLDGLTRYEVADKVAAYGISRGAYAGISVRRAIVVTGRDFPDCLTAAVLASRLKGVVLLTPTPGLSPGASTHLREYRKERLDVYVGGGTASVSAATFDQIKAAVAN
jgi:putative cell wall-binding protein